MELHLVEFVQKLATLEWGLFVSVLKVGSICGLCLKIMTLLKEPNV